MVCRLRDYKTNKTMETIINNLPLIQKATIARQNTAAEAACCAPKNETSVCCTPSKSKDENGGACCAQPEDGSSCCEK
jgi:hypothetical protein